MTRVERVALALAFALAFGAFVGLIAHSMPNARGFAHGRSQ